MPNQLIKSILEVNDVQALQVDFSQLKKIPRENAASMQVIIYYKDEENYVYIVTTNNHPEDLIKPVFIPACWSNFSPIPSRVLNFFNSSPFSE